MQERAVPPGAPLHLSVGEDDGVFRLRSVGPGESVTVGSPIPTSKTTTVVTVVRNGTGQRLFGRAGVARMEPSRASKKAVATPQSAFSVRRRASDEWQRMAREAAESVCCGGGLPQGWLSQPHNPGPTSFSP